MAGGDPPPREGLIPAAMTYAHLDSGLVVATLERLERRIGDRFPDSGLHGVSLEMLDVARQTAGRVDELQRPRWAVRIGVTLLIVTLLGIVTWTAVQLAALRRTDELGASVQAIESVAQEVIFISIGILFLATAEARMKRHAALRSLRELRSLAHVIDMHQLTKDPDQFDPDWAPSPASPERTLTRAELRRYLDYCSELLSITSKLAALYAQQLDDPVVLDAVSDIQSLSGSLSNKIWQKIGMLG